MQQYEHDAERLVEMYDRNDRVAVTNELNHMDRWASLVVIAIMVRRMTADNGERFIGFLATQAMSSVHDTRPE